MSFDLQLVASNEKSLPAKSAVDRWLNDIEHFNCEHPGQAAYENPATGVYFSLFRSGEGLDLNLNFCRPTFFALECFEVMASLAKAHDLAVIDPQGSGEVTPYDAQALVRSWKKSNQFACSAMHKASGSLQYMEETKATDMWRYQREYPRLKEQHDEGFVPQVIVVAHKGKLLRAAHLTKPCNYLVPPVDVFYLQTNGIVRAEVVLKFLAPHLSEVRGDEWLKEVSEDTCLDIMEEWDAHYDSWRPDFMISDVERVAMDGFVDVKPEAK
jgi:hypothetical protein